MGGPFCALLRFSTCGHWVLAITLAPKKLILTRRASEGSASEPSLARRVSMCKDAKLSCRGNIGAPLSLPSDQINHSNLAVLTAV